MTTSINKGKVWVSELNARPEIRSAFSGAAVRFYDTTLREFVVPYETVRGSADPEGTLLDFLSTTYAAAADAAGWDRAALECPLGGPGRVRPI